jgi:phosphoribosylglycinamide formyltransferase 1
MSSRVAVLASGSGTNLQAILDHGALLGTAASAKVVLVASHRADAGALVRARDRGIAAVALTAEQRDVGLFSLLQTHGVELIALAGYTRMVPADVVAAFRGRIVNVHPALLPAFGGTGMYGARVHEAVIASGARISGVTVHFVDEVYDHGPIIAQWPVPVFGSDDGPTLARRVLAAEHWFYPRVVDALAAGRVTFDGRRARGVLDIAPPDAHFALEVGLPFPSGSLDALLDR